MIAFETVRYRPLFGISALAIVGALLAPHAVGGEQDDVLAKAYAECDKLLVIPPPGENLRELYQSAHRVSQCKDKAYREIFADRRAD